MPRAELANELERLIEDWLRDRLTALGLAQFVSDHSEAILTALRSDRDPAEVENERLREALTPSAETKAAYIGEFSFQVEDTDDEWGLPVTRTCDVPWTTIKEIMAAIRDYAARLALQEKRL